MALVCVGVASGHERVDREPIEPVVSDTGMVVSDTPLASGIGAEVLAQGGNAADAAVATAFALAVTWPEAGNIGGGGFAMVSRRGEKVVCVDYREKAPAAATIDMFQEKTTRFWYGQVGVPGTVAGMALIHERWGSVPWRELIEPSIELAAGGFVVNEALALSMNEVLGEVRDEPERFAELIRVYGKPDGSAWQAGDRLTLPDLAGTLRQIAEDGPQAFYEGEIAAAVAEAMAAGNGLITREDLANYQAKIRPAIHVRFDGYDVYGPPPPSSGGLTLAMELNQLASLDLAGSPRFSARTLHLMAEAMRRAYFWRARAMGDSDFVDVPFAIGSRVFGKLLATTIDPDHATDSATLEPAIPLGPESPSTTHFSIVDDQGLAISNTYTIEMSWGSRMIIPGTGFLLNNEMGDFNEEPGVTTTAGQIGTPPNIIEPGKRPLSSQCPVIVRRDGKVVLLTGSPGGRTIINTACNILVSYLAYDMSLVDAVDAPRIHHQWMPDEIEFEAANQPAYADAVAQLREMGHEVVYDGRQGSANSIAIDPGTGEFTGVPDWRRGAAAAAPAPDSKAQGQAAQHRASSDISR